MKYEKNKQKGNKSVPNRNKENTKKVAFSDIIPHFTIFFQSTYVELPSCQKLNLASSYGQEMQMIWSGNVNAAGKVVECSVFVNHNLFLGLTELRKKFANRISLIWYSDMCALQNIKLKKHNGRKQWWWKSQRVKFWHFLWKSHAIPRHLYNTWSYPSQWEQQHVEIHTV